MIYSECRTTALSLRIIAKLLIPSVSVYIVLVRFDIVDFYQLSFVTCNIIHKGNLMPLSWLLWTCR